jgi:hypothetical protein
VKTLAVVLAALIFFSLPRVLSAAENVRADADLLVGVVRTQTGDAIANASVRADDDRGHLVGTGTTAADGTFGFATSARAAFVVVRCAFCTTLRRSVVAGEPPILVVYRSPARERSPSRDDLASLPYDRLSDALALVPYAVVARDVVSDRGLGGGSGAVVFDGIPQYRAIDGGDPTLALGPRDAAAVTTFGPIDSARYGGGAQGGLFLVDTTGAAERERFAGGNGDAATVHVDAGDASVSAARTDASGVRRARLSGAIGGALGNPDLRYQASAVTASDATGSASGAAYRIAEAARTYDLAVAASIGRSVTDATVVQHDAEEALTASVRTRSAVAVEAGVRVTRATGDWSTLPGAHDPEAWAGIVTTSALFVGMTTERGPWTVTANADLGRLTAGVTGAHTDRRTTLDGGLRVARALGDFTLSADAVEATRPLTIDGYFGASGATAARTMLLDVNAGYAASIVRLDATYYRERGLSGGTAGYGATIGLALAPHLALRSWLLRGANTGNVFAVYPASATLAPRTGRDLVWLTYDASVRVDALLRGGRFEGDVVVPIRRSVALQFGSYVPAGSARRTTAALQFR